MSTTDLISFRPVDSRTNLAQYHPEVQLPMTTALAGSRNTMSTEGIKSKARFVSFIGFPYKKIDKLGTSFFILVCTLHTPQQLQLRKEGEKGHRRKKDPNIMTPLVNEPFPKAFALLLFFLFFCLVSLLSAKSFQPWSCCRSEKEKNKMQREEKPC